MEQVAKVNILLVDDREENLLALNDVLASPEYNLILANSGAEALARLEEREFAVVLMDVQMPGMSGLETARRIRSVERSRTTPIILVTGMYPGEDSIRLGYEVGAVDLLSKPFDPRVMKSKVAVFVDLFRKTEKIRLQEKLLHETSQSRFHTIFEQSPLAIQLFHPSGRSVEVNSAWENLWGDESPALKEEGGPFSSLVRRAIEGQSSELPPVFFRGKWVECSVYPVRNEQREIREVVAIFKDVTDRIVADEELRQSRDELQRAVQARDEFISIASHELKTPLTSLLLHLDIASLQLDREPLGELREAIRRFVTVSGAQIERLSKLIEGVLDVSRITQGNLVLKRESLNLSELVRGVMSDLTGQLRESNIEVCFDGPQDVLLQCDRDRIHQVVTNLLTNAMKYGEGKPISISLQTQDGSVHLSVRDQGIGIAPEHHQRIFERFERVVSPSSVTGLGLGLYIVTRIVRAHGGSISVKSTPGQGSVFTVSLPAMADAKLEITV